VNESSSFFSVWAQNSPYWLLVEGPLAATLSGFSLVYQRGDLAAIQTPANWSDVWHTHAPAIMKHGGAGHRAAVIAAADLPTMHDIQQALRPVAEVAAIASNLWLIEAINHGRLDCYLQRVMDRRGKQVGYEAFARMESADGGVIGGGAIMQAAHALRVEYQLDRLLHKQAIECYAGGDLDGYIFINFLTGFIHRPEVYLDGLSQAVTRAHVRPGAVVLDVPLGDYARDMAKLKSIAQFCRSRGFSLALDDVVTSDGLASLMSDIRPAFVKLHGRFGQGMSEIRAQSMLHEVVRVSHANGVAVLAEGVETAAQHEHYLLAEVDMFQGYLFGAPERFPRGAGYET
jgi:EAL domain-containing protein (putative c-di-GMP-specific phosphodiesterase class I)